MAYAVGEVLSVDGTGRILTQPIDGPFEGYVEAWLVAKHFRRYNQDRIFIVADLGAPPEDPVRAPAPVYE